MMMMWWEAVKSVISDGLEIALLIAPALLVHEYGHALMAMLLGDDHEEIRERIANPLRFFSWKLLPISIVTGLWIAMTPVRRWRIRRGKLGYAAVVLAGPAMNILAGILIAAGHGVYIVTCECSCIGDDLWFRVQSLSAMNFFIAFFNLLPLFPLDGGRLLRLALPRCVWLRTGLRYWGMCTLAFLLITTLLNDSIGVRLFDPLIDPSLKVYHKVYGAAMNGMYNVRDWLGQSPRPMA